MDNKDDLYDLFKEAFGSETPERPVDGQTAQPLTLRDIVAAEKVFADHHLVRARLDAEIEQAKIKRMEADFKGVFANGCDAILTELSGEGVLMWTFAHRLMMIGMDCEVILKHVNKIKNFDGDKNEMLNMGLLVVAAWRPKKPDAMILKDIPQPTRQPQKQPKKNTQWDAKGRQKPKK